MAMRDLLKLSDFAMVPLAIGVLFLCTPLDAVYLPLAFAGLVGWTLAEYATHRAFHHPRLRTVRAAHMRHHQHPRELVGGTAYTTVLIGVLVVACGRYLPAAAPALQGFLAGYLAFCFLHAANHHLPAVARRLPGLMWLHDRHHHGPANRAYGVTTSVWDRLLGTL